MKLQIKVIHLVVVLALTGCSQKSPEELLANAQQKIALNQTSEAIIDLKIAIQVEPKNAKLRFLLGDVYLKQGEGLLAERELRLAVDLGKNIKLVLPKLLNSLNLQDKKFEILSMIEKHKDGQLELMPQVLFYAGLANIDAGKNNAAMAAFTKANEVSPESNYSKLGDAYLNSEAQKIDVALLIIEDVLNKDPSISEALMLKGNLLHLKSDYTGATIAYQQYLELLPKALKVRMFLARELIQDKKLSEATKHLDYLLKRFPEQPFVNQLKGVIAFEKQNYQSSLYLTEKAIQNGINSLSNRVVAGISAFKLQQYEIAYEYLVNTADQFLPDHPIKKILAMVQIQLGYVDEAYLVLSDLETLTAEDVNLLTAASYDLMKLGKAYEAKLLLDKTKFVDGIDVQKMTQIGVLQISMNDLDGITNLENALEISPESPMAKMALAAAYISNKEYDKALDLARKLKEDQSLTIEGYNLTAKILFLKNQINNAESELNRALNINEYNPYSLLYFANKAFEEKSLKESIKLIEKLLSSTPRHIQALTLNYRVHKALNTESIAVERIAACFSEEQKNNSCRLLYSRVLFIENNFEKVVDLLRRTTGELTTPSLQWVLLGESYLKLLQNQKALAIYDDWIETQPQNRNAWLRKVSTQEILTDYRGALLTVEQLLSRYPNDTQFKVFRARYLILTKNFSKAREYIKSLTEEEQQLPIIRGLQGQLWLTEGEFEKAIPGLEKLYQLLPNTHNTALLFATHKRLGEKQVAFDFLQQHIELYPDDKISRLLLAENAMTFNLEITIKHYLVLLQLSPNNISILNNLAWAEYQLGNYASANTFINNALKLELPHPQVFDTAGLIQLELGNKDRAVELLRKAKSLSPNDEVINKHYNEAVAQ
jgi:putative PEP-CTERM system TPR-repeat lipoprotein